MAKVLVWATGLFFVLYGAAFIAFPMEMATLITDDSPSTPSGLIDFRATYGGMSIAVGVTILILAARAESIQLSLLVTGIVLFGMAIGRGLGIVLDGSPNIIMVIYLGAELVFGGLAFLLRSKIGREGKP